MEPEDSLPNLLVPVTDILGQMQNDAQEDAVLVVKSYHEYEDTVVKTDEISRAETNIIEAEGVSKDTRLSIESYVGDEDDTLPKLNTYTSEPSIVNFDKTLSWVNSYKEQTQVQQLRDGAKFLSLAIHWLNHYAIETDKDELDSLFESLEFNTNQCNEVIADNDYVINEPDEVLSQLCAELNVEKPELTIDAGPFLTNKVCKTKVLDALLSTTMSPCVNGLSLMLITSDEAKDDFKDFYKSVERLVTSLINVINKLACGEDARVDLGKIEGGINYINDATNKYTVLLSQKGVCDFASTKTLDKILKATSKRSELLDDDLSKELCLTRDELIKVYDLDNIGDDVTVDVEVTDALLQAVEHNNTVMSSVLDALRLILGLRNSAIQLANAKNNTLKTYYMFVVSVVE